MRIQRTLLSALISFLLLITIGKEVAAQQENLTFAPLVLEKLNSIRAELGGGIKNKKIEDVRCLLGNKKGNRVYVTGLYRPQITLATYSRVVTNLACPQTAQIKIVGLWHNHPSSLCALSEDDQKTSVRNGFPIIMLHCSDKRWAWWSINQVKKFSIPGKILYPLPGQDMVNNNSK